MKLTFTKPRGWNSLRLFEKIQYYKTILDENYSKYVDKYNVKFLFYNLYELKFAKVIKIIKNDNDFLLSDIKSGYILKANHGCKWNIFLDETSMKLNINQIRNYIKSWLKTKFIFHNEKQYEYIKPIIFIEEVIDDYFFGKTKKAVTYMFRCIHGVPYTFSIKNENDNTTNSFDIQFNLLLPKQHNLSISMNNFNRMKNLAKQLSENFEFVRIDFYLDKNEDIYFSEFTFTPMSGLQYFNDETEIKLGKLWI